jgi:hypothetical protein
VEDWATLTRWCDDGKASGIANVQFLVGAVRYRRGLFREAVGELRRGPADAADLFGVATNLFAAMALSRDGDPKAAADALSRARRQMEGLSLAEHPWVDRAKVELLAREAVTLVEKTAQ